jgi:hypothetical protein
LVLFTAIIGHSLNQEEIFTAADFLNSIQPEIQPCLSILHEHLTSMDHPTHWQWGHINQPIQWQWTVREGHSLYEDFQRHGIVYLDATELFWAKVSKHLFEFGCWSIIKWSRFLREPKASEGLRCLCRRLAKAFDSRLIVYVPDSGGPPSGAGGLLYCEAGIEEVVTWLQMNCGPPANTLEEIFPEGAEVVNQNGYFIETAS